MLSGREAERRLFLLARRDTPASGGRVAGSPPPVVPTTLTPLLLGRFQIQNHRLDLGH
jgi:hypothetical protein